MSKVLASLKPYFYYLVGERLKKIEVRKGKPKAKDWNREVLFYMSKDEKSFAKIPKELQGKYRKHFGKVGLEFICDKIETVNANCSDYGIDLFYHDCATEGCLTENEVNKYFNIPKDKDLRVMKGNGYAWHISNLKIYDKPKELIELRVQNKKDIGWDVQTVPLFRPPQSWCYVEEN